MQEQNSQKNTEANTAQNVAQNVAQNTAQNVVQNSDNTSPATVLEPKISIDDFKKVEIKIGQIKSVEKVANADKLLRLIVDFGDHERQIVSGIAEHYQNFDELIDKKCPFITNLAPRTIKNLESDGMIMAALDKQNNKLSILNVDDAISPGTKIS
ncbi:MAG TPA: methionine--tRNA ligase subunit beta [Candidatus Paceibacterota bacterium]|nr:methionine--tRNA ligase subunit beta [Candidatus Paceibacterota bacterium]